MKLLNRTERFLRTLRSLAFGPAAHPPRQIIVTSDLQALYDSLDVQNNPNWCVEYLAAEGLGSK